MSKINSDFVSHIEIQETIHHEENKNSDNRLL